MPMTNYLRNKVHDWLHRGQAFSPPATMWLALVTTTPTAATPGTEVAAASYGRIAVAASMVALSGTQSAGSSTASTGSNGIISNNALLDFGTAAEAWGTVSHWELYDDETAGNRLEFGTIVNSSGVATPRSILADDPVSFPIGQLQLRIV